VVSWHWTQAHPEENTDEQPNFTVGSEEWVSRRRRWQLQHKLQLWSGPAPADHQNSSYGNIRLLISYNLVGGRSRFACQVMLVTSGCSFIRPEVQAASCRVWLVITCWPVCIFICIVNCIVRFIVYLLIYTPSRSSNLWQYIRVHGHDSMWDGIIGERTDYVVMRKWSGLATESVNVHKVGSPSWTSDAQSHCFTGATT